MHQSLHARSVALVWLSVGGVSLTPVDPRERLWGRWGLLRSLAKALAWAASYYIESSIAASLIIKVLR